MEYVATPWDSDLVPNAVASSMKVTVPVGVSPDALTVATKVTPSPAVDGLALESTVVLVE